MTGFMTGRSVARLFVKAALFSICVMGPAAAQTSSSYKLQEASINNGGDPRGGMVVASAHYHISLDVIGDGVVRAGLSSASFHVDAGFVGRYRPSGEVTGLRFTDATTLQWNAEPSADRYEVYRATSLPGTFGSCFAGDLLTQFAADASIPSTGSRFYYMVTARNHLAEEGTKGYGSNGVERTNTLPCP